MTNFFFSGFTASDPIQLHLCHGHYRECGEGFIFPIDFGQVNIEVASTPPIGQIRLKCHASRDAQHSDGKTGLIFLQRVLGDRAAQNTPGYHNGHLGDGSYLSREINKISF